MVRCIDCGFLGFYMDLRDGLRWREMDRRIRQALEQGKEYNPPGQNPGPGHWNYVRCNKYLQEWGVWSDAPPSRDDLQGTLVKDRECDGYTEYQPGLSPPEHRTIAQAAGPTVRELDYDVFLSHSSYDDELAQEIKRLLELNGVRTFSTPGSIPSGKWEPQIEQALQRSGEIWVLLTKDALERSVWVHHEFGYFYGFRHGEGQDLEGKQCRYLFEAGTQRPGLYDHIQGTEIGSFQNPLDVAETIANAMGKSFSRPTGYVPQSASLRGSTPRNVPNLTLGGGGSSADIANKIQRAQIEIKTTEPIFLPDVVALSDRVQVHALPKQHQISGKGYLPLEVSWKGHSEGQSLPADLVDGRNRIVRLTERPHDPGKGYILVITFSTQDNRLLGAVTYFEVKPHGKGFPEFQLIQPGAPFGWLELSQPQ